MNLAIVLGTRPEIVKLAPVIRALPEGSAVIHTGQHYDSNMAQVFFDAFGLAEPDHYLAIGGATRGQQIGEAVKRLDEVFAELEPEAVIAQGDTNSTMAAAIAANARSIPSVHVEAGLRSHDRRMPEEHNRVVADHLADLCLAPTGMSASNLTAEGVDEDRIRVTGNTVVDAVEHLLPLADERSAILDKYGLASEEFVLSTFHRPENVDDARTLKTIVDELRAITLPVVLPLHPRTRSIAREYGINLESEEVRVIDPLGYIEFLALLAECRVAVADSGGLQEEVSVLKRPMVVVRRTTERPEVLGTFSSLVSVGEDISATSRRWLTNDPYSLTQLREIKSPYGDGYAGERCAEQVIRLVRGPSRASDPLA